MGPDRNQTTDLVSGGERSPMTSGLAWQAAEVLKCWGYSGTNTGLSKAASLVDGKKQEQSYFLA